MRMDALSLLCVFTRGAIQYIYIFVYVRIQYTQYSAARRSIRIIPGDNQQQRR